MVQPIRPVAGTLGRREATPANDKHKLVKLPDRVEAGNVVTALSYDAVKKVGDISEDREFLELKIAAQKKSESFVQETPIQEIISRPEEYLEDADHMTASELKDKYKTTYSSWTNMKTRVRNEGYLLDPDFERFVDFLKSVGPRPSADQTLDRIDPTDRMYGPGKVRWLDKRGQANNREVTISLTARGETKPLGLWAYETGQRPDTLRSRRNKGWSDEEIIFGKGPSISYGTSPWNYQPWAGGNYERRMEDNYQKYGNRYEHRVQFAIRVCEARIFPWMEFFEENYQSEDDPEVIEADALLNYTLPKLDALRRVKDAIAPLLTTGTMPPGWYGPTRHKPQPDFRRR